MNEQTNQQTDLANQWITKQAAIDALTEVESHYEFEDGHDHLISWAKIKIFVLPPAQQIQTNTPNALKSLDCVDRQAAIDALAKGVWRVDWDKALAEVIIKDLPSVQSQWIPVTDRLPEEDKEVLISYRYKEGEGDTSHAYIDITTYGQMYFGGNKVGNHKHWRQPFEYFTSNYEVVAWMPLPDPWKGEQE